MSKSVLIIDTPASCAACPLFSNYYTDMCCKGSHNRGINYPYPEDFRQDWCPLIPVPECKDMTKYHSVDAITMEEVVQCAHDNGYNECLEDITPPEKYVLIFPEDEVFMRKDQVEND